MTLKVALVGLGHQALGDHLPALRKLPGVAVTAGVDPDALRRSEFSRRVPDAAVFTDYKSLGGEVDAVLISMPHFLHFEATSHFLRQGIPVLKEKPAALNFREAEALAELSAKTGTVLMVAVQRRFQSHYDHVPRLLDRIGTAFFVDAKYNIFTSEPHTGWRGQRALAGGGCLIDMGYHLVDQVIRFLGLPDRLQCQMSHSFIENFAYDAEDTARVSFNYDGSGLWGSLLVSRVIPPKSECIDVVGTRGMVRITKKSVELLTSQGQILETVLAPEGEDALCLQAANFVEAVGGGRCLSPIASHLDHLRFIDACYESARTSGTADCRLPAPEVASFRPPSVFNNVALGVSHG